MALHTKLKEYRESKGLKQADLADLGAVLVVERGADDFAGLGLVEHVSLQRLRTLACALPAVPGDALPPRRVKLTV